MAVTIARLAFSSALNRLDLPTFGAPTIATCGALAHQAPACGLREQRVDARDQRGDRYAGFLRRHEVIALLGKIERRLEPAP